MNYNKYKQAEIDPSTGISVLFNPGYYQMCAKGRYRNNLCKANKNNDCLNKHRKELINLAAYGLKPTLCHKVLSLNYPELLNVKRGAFDSFFTRSVYYYSFHPNQLSKVIKDFRSISESLINNYEKELNEEHVDKNNLLNVQYSNTNLPTLPQIQNLLQIILDISQINVPARQSNKKLEQERQDILKLISECKNPILLGKHYSRLIEILTEQQNNNSSGIKEKDKIYEAITSLSDSGIVSSIYRWMSLYMK